MRISTGCYASWQSSGAVFDFIHAHPRPALRERRTPSHPPVHQSRRHARHRHARHGARRRRVSVGRARAQDARRPRRPLVRECRLRLRGDRRRGVRTDAAAPVLPLVFQHHHRAGHPARGEDRVARPARARARHVHKLRLRGERDSAQAHPRHHEAARHAAEDEDPDARLRLPRRDARDDEHDGAAELHRALRPAAARLHPRAGAECVCGQSRERSRGLRQVVRRADGAAHPSRGPRHHRGAFHRADPGRGRRHRAAGGLSTGDARAGAEV